MTEIKKNNQSLVASRVAQAKASNPVAVNKPIIVFGQTAAPASSAQQFAKTTTAPIVVKKSPVQPSAANFFKAQPDEYTIKEGDTISKLLSKEIVQVLPNIDEKKKKDFIANLLVDIKDSEKLSDVEHVKIGQKINLKSTRKNIIDFKNGTYVPKALRGIKASLINREIGYTEPVVEKPKTYTVKKGDKLSKIALKFGLSVSELSKINGIKEANNIPVGQKLQLGEHADTKDAARVAKMLQAIKPQPQAETPVKVTSGLYQAKQGDTLLKIAREQNIPIKELCRLNGIPETYALNAGESLRLKEGDNKEMKGLLGKIANSKLQPQKWETAEKLYKYNVLSGDNPQKIAKRFREVTGSKASTTDIIAAIEKNNPGLANGQFKNLKAGQLIDIPFDVPITDSLYNKHKAILSDTKINLSPVQARSLEKFVDHYKRNKQRYDRVAEITGYPPALIAALHFRESVEPDKFNTYMHNGAKVGTVSTIVPKGIKFDTWEESAIDLLNNEDNSRYKKMYRFDKNSNDIVGMVAFAERHNGGGYNKQGINSPYIYSGTDKYTTGKFDADKHFNPNAVDKQIGLYAMVKACEKN